MENVNKPHLWNMFNQVTMHSQDVRHHRFCLRLMLKNPDNHALCVLNGHNAFVSGSFKHALGKCPGTWLCRVWMLWWLTARPLEWRFLGSNSSSSCKLSSLPLPPCISEMERIIGPILEIVVKIKWVNIKYLTQCMAHIVSACVSKNDNNIDMSFSYEALVSKWSLIIYFKGQPFSLLELIFLKWFSLIMDVLLPDFNLLQYKKGFKICW